jgi:hypothetical protein
MEKALLYCDAGSLPLSKRDQIPEWVRRVIASGSTDYRRFLTDGRKRTTVYLRQRRSRIRICFLVWSLHPSACKGDGRPHPLQDIEMTEIGYHRNGVWNEETASQKIEYRIDVRGTRGIP